MNWQMVFARDSVLWRICFYAGMVVVLATGFIDNPADYGLSPMVFKWLKLAAAVITAIGGKNGMSFVPLQRNMGGDK